MEEEEEEEQGEEIERMVLRRDRDGKENVWVLWEP